MLISIVIPYKNRLDNIGLAFEALSRQLAGKDAFEVVVGAMEYSVDYVALCARYQDRLHIRTVMTSDPWQVGLARNMAIRQTIGEVIVLLDVDMIVSPSFVGDLYARHFSAGQNHCVIGQMIDYDNNNSDVESVEVRPFAYYQSQLAELETRSPFIVDERWKVQCHLPWAFAWTALVAIPRRLVFEYELFFDLNFRGYGVEDLEWARRIHESKIPIVLEQDVWGIHLPHVRNLGANRQSERLNYRYFLKKWPEYDVELVSAFGDFRGNSLWSAFAGELRSAMRGREGRLSVVRATVDGRRILALGVICNDQSASISPDGLPQLAGASDIESMPILGLRVPFEDQSFDSSILLPSLAGLSEPFMGALLEESKRVARSVERLWTT